jgi:hypothetical protein
MVLKINEKKLLQQIQKTFESNAEPLTLETVYIIYWQFIETGKLYSDFYMDVAMCRIYIYRAIH